MCYTTFADFLARFFPCKMQKLSVNAGLSCPNRDGTLGTGGCIYCNNASFSPLGETAPAIGIARQIEEGRRFFGRKYKDMRYLAYFQSYTSTHAPLPRLEAMFGEALGQPDVDGLIIGTRPDCMPDSLLELLGGMTRERFIMVEYGAESIHDATLARINRHHTWSDTVSAVERTSRAGIHVGLHFINGLPGESREMILGGVRAINTLPVEVVKYHQMQVVIGTELARQWLRGEAGITEYTLEQYLDLCADIVALLRPGTAIDRFTSQSPADMLLCPRWGVKNHEFAALLDKRLRAGRG